MIEIVVVVVVENGCLATMNVVDIKVVVMMMDRWDCWNVVRVDVGAVDMCNWMMVDIHVNKHNMDDRVEDDVEQTKLHMVIIWVNMVMMVVIHYDDVVIDDDVDD